MEFRTIVNIADSTLRIDYHSQLMLLGSCFAQSIGKYLCDNKFNVIVNPFGILYNPASIAKVLLRLHNKIHFTQEELFLHDGLCHSFLHHGDFSNPIKEECLANINQEYEKAAANLFQTDTLIITFGTAYVFENRKTSEVVANCHKLPASQFSRSRLTVKQIVTEWTELIRVLRSDNPDLNLLFTVSPIRHWKDGAHENQLSKATLLLAIDEICRNHNNIYYFPSYELMLDDLRDYRFYAEDMIHPNDTAVKYIWDAFKDTFFDSQTENIIKEWQHIKLAVSHRPFNPDTAEHKQFLRQTLLKLDAFCEKYPYFDCSKEKDILKDQLL